MRVCLKISGCKFQKGFWVWMHSHVYIRIVSEFAYYVVRVSPHCVVCLLLMCMDLRVYVCAGSMHTLSDTLLNSLQTPPTPTHV